MKLKNLTERFVKDFADSVIYQKGHVYYKDGMVSELEYDPENDFITAEVSGNYVNL